MTSSGDSIGPANDGGLIHVAAAALIDDRDRVLLARRPVDAHQGGLWEFPGGKRETGESVAEALRRELHEELGIVLQRHRPLIRVHHQYADRSVLLDVHRVTAWRGQPVGRQGQPLAWVLPEELHDYPMPAADEPIVSADQTGFLRALERSVADGIRLVQLRLFDIDDATLLQIGRAACALCHAGQARVLLNGSPETAAAIGADGVHLNGRALYMHSQRPIEASQLVAASCHTPQDLVQAAGLGADFALLSPVLPTRSHPDADPLGWERFASWVDDARLPVFALGGMHPDLLETAWRHGAQGIAGIRGLWSDEPAG
jgi:8-oxo-dGTP diphosphatase